MSVQAPAHLAAQAVIKAIEHPADTKVPRAAISVPAALPVLEAPWVPAAFAVPCTPHAPSPEALLPELRELGPSPPADVPALAHAQALEHLVPVALQERRATWLERPNPACVQQLARVQQARSGTRRAKKAR